MAIVYYHHYRLKNGSGELKHNNFDDNFQSDYIKYDSELVDFSVSREPHSYDYACSDHFVDRVFFGKDERSAFYVSAIGYERPWIERIVQSKHLDRYVINFVFEGSGYFNDLPIQSGQAFICLPGEKYTIVNDPKQPLRYGWISVNGYDLENQIRLLSLPISPIFSISDVEKIERSMKKAVYYSKYDLSLQNTRQLLISRLFRSFSLLDFEVCPKQSEHGAYMSYIDVVKNHINTNYSCNLTVSDLAAQAGVSPSYLRQIFTSHLGMSPQEAIIQKRMSVAKKMLKETRDPISEIAQKCGYTDQSAFCKVFKKTQEISPLRYRKQSKIKDMQ